MRTAAPGRGFDAASRRVCNGAWQVNERGCYQGRSRSPRAIHERENIAAADWRERKRRERRALTTCGCTAADSRVRFDLVCTLLRLYDDKHWIPDP